MIADLHFGKSNVRFFCWDVYSERDDRAVTSTAYDQFPTIALQMLLPLTYRFGSRRQVCYLAWRAYDMGCRRYGGLQLPLF